MPHTPGYVLGIINLRGAVMPVIDLRCRLGLGITEASSRHVIVVIQHGAQLAVGWRVEIEIALLRQVGPMPADALSPPHKRTLPTSEKSRGCVKTPPNQLES